LTPRQTTGYVGFAAGNHMTDKQRHRPHPAPHGFLPNWVLVMFAAGAIAVASLAHTLI
jgi:hypothetical protein